MQAQQHTVLFGAGSMAEAYAKVLQSQAVAFEVVGRSQSGVERFAANARQAALPGGFDAWQAQGGKADRAIVAVSVEALAPTVISLMEQGCRKILLEKPGGVNLDEIQAVCAKATATGSKILVAYNRRFYASTLRAQEIIREDGGVLSFAFEFTEWPHSVLECIKHPEVLRHWFLANSSHVVDMAFLLGGRPRTISAFTAGGCDWHPSAAVFAGAGQTEAGALFSYQANWLAPGRWGVEVMTRQRRLIFRPLEKLQIQLHKSVAINPVELDDRLDREFKPGVFLQTEAFLKGLEHPNLMDIHQHCRNVSDHLQVILAARP